VTVATAAQAGFVSCEACRCGGQGVTIFFGLARPVRAPEIGPARPVLAALMFT